MIFGAITNSWRLQLSDQSLTTLVEMAQSNDARHVELRQTCLGEMETGEDREWRPVLPKLQQLVDAFPGMAFDLAMAFPCLTQRIDPRDEQFQAALEAARVVGREASPISVWWTRPAPPKFGKRPLTFRKKLWALRTWPVRRRGKA